jgi:hypothetical protein
MVSRYRRRVPYVASFAHTGWRGSRREAIDTLAAAHAATGEISGPGRPLEIGRPVAHAYLLRVVAEFQGFVRDLHDLAVEKAVELSGAEPAYRPLLTAAATEGRLIDRGNADERSPKSDFKRLGITGTGLSNRIQSKNGRWTSTTAFRGDQAYYQDLIELRNCLAHGSQGQLDRLRRDGVHDTLTYGRRRLPGLDRIALALDRVEWDHLCATFGVDPW